MANKVITFTLGAEGVVTPTTEQKAGNQGSHNVTEVRFDVSALGLSENHRLRIQFIDGAGGFYSTGFLDVADNTVSTPLSDDVTNAGGLAYVYLVVSEIIYNGEDAPATENQVLISSGGKLRFTHSGVGSPSEYTYRTRISNALVNAEIFVGQAEKHAEESLGYSNTAGEYAENAASSAENAADSATNAANALQALNDGIASGDFKGDQGPRGPQGEKGDKGDKGEKGDTPDLTNHIRIWQPNTEYKIGDVVISDISFDGFYYFQAILFCRRDHTSQNLNEDMRLDLYEDIRSGMWNVKPFISREAETDSKGNYFPDHYATKEEVEEALENIPTGEGGTITIDQTYNPESENAQSGKAVAEAIASVIESETEEIVSVIDPTQIYEKGVIYYVADSNRLFIQSNNYADTYVYQLYAGKKYRFNATVLTQFPIVYATGNTLYTRPASGYGTGILVTNSFTEVGNLISKEYEFIPDEDCYLYRQISATYTATEMYMVTEVVLKEEKEKGVPSFKVAEDGNNIEISYPYANEILSVVLEKRGGNNLFDFRKISTPSTTIFDATLSDWHSPFVVCAVNNADGDTPDNQYFTGGSHQTNNANSGGAVTARTAELKFFANGKLLSNGASGNARHIEMKWTNFVQAYNTTKTDGSGREVLQENHSLVFANGKFNANVEIIPLEDITIKTYYGLQGITNHYKKIRYIGGTNRGLYEGESESGDLTTYCIECSSDNHKMCIEIDPMLDLGKRSDAFVNGTKGIFSTDYGKCYFSIINKPVNMNSGDTYYLRGSWEFKPNF